MKSAVVRGVMLIAGALVVSHAVLVGEGVALAADVASIPRGDLGIAPIGDTTSVAGASIKMIGGLFLCFGVLAIGAKYLKRYGARGVGGGRRRLELRDKIMLSPKASVALVAVDNREFLIATGSDSVSILPTNSLSSQLFAESLSEVDNDAEVADA